MKLWVLSAGDYSAWHIIGIFDDPARIDEFKQNYPKPDSYYGDYNDPIVIVLNEPVEKAQLGLWPFAVWMGWESGDVKSVERLIEPIEYEADDALPEYDPGATYNGKHYEGELRMDVWARDEDHAIKIVIDKRRAVLSARRPDDGSTES